MVRWWLALALGMAARIALAQGPIDDEARRTALYREGVKLSDAGQWAEAAARFRDVLAIRSSPQALFSLAQAEEKTGVLATAEHTYERALTDARAANMPDVADAAKRALSGIEPRVPRLVVRTSANIVGATATIDENAAVLGDPVHVDPGDHHVAVVATGRTRYDAHVMLSEGQSLTVVAELPPERAIAVIPPRNENQVPSPPAEQKAVTRSRFPGAAIALGITGLVVAAGGGVLYGVGDATYGNAAGRCTNGVCSTAQDASAGNTGRTEMIAGDIVLAAGLATVAVAVVLWLVLPRHPPSSHASAWPVLTF